VTCLTSSIHEYGNDEEQSSRLKDAIAKNNVFLLGDLNMHFPMENNGLEESGFNDLWLEHNSHMSGFTWDTHTNRMLWMMLFDDRRMRLDRV